MASENITNSVEVLTDKVFNPLPPMVFNNLREKLDAEQVSIDGITHNSSHENNSAAHKTEEDRILSQPRPLYHLTIIFCPSILNFIIDDLEIVHTLRVWNPLPRSIYLHCCGFWDEACRLGAYWHCYPRTRLKLVPGLPVDIYVKARPREVSTIQHTTIRLQLAAAHKGDLVVGYFVVPIQVTFRKYLPPLLQPAEHLDLERCE